MQQKKSFWNDRFDLRSTIRLHFLISCIVHFTFRSTLSAIENKIICQVILVRERIAQSDLSEKSSQGILHFTSQQSNWTKVGAKALSYETIIIVVCTNCTHTTTLACLTTYTIKLNVLPYKLKSIKDLTFLKCEPTTCKANYIQFKSLRSKQADLTQQREEMNQIARWTKERVKEFQQRNWCTKTKQR